jgi:Spy/CpxP family protein refolding chaperone
MKKRKWLLLGSCIVTHCFLSTLPAFAEYTQVNWETLDLNPQQRATLYSLDRQWRISVAEVAPKIAAKEHRLKQMMNACNANEDDILHLQQEIHEDKMHLKMQATQIFLDKRRVLTPEQNAHLLQMMNLR